MELLRESLSALPAALADDEIVLGWRPIAASDAELAVLRETLSEGERAIAARYHFERDRRASVVSRGTLRTVLGRVLDRAPASIELAVGPHGKPALRERELEFNVSHADAYLLIGLSRRELGVDVEGGPRPIGIDELAPTVFTPRELAELAAYAGDARRDAFLRAWTRKEAYLKARAVGLSLPLKDFSVSLAAEATLSSDVDPAEAARFVLVGLPAPAGYEAAVCWSKVDPPVRRLRTLRMPAPG